MSRANHYTTYCSGLGQCERACSVVLSLDHQPESEQILTTRLPDKAGQRSRERSKEDHSILFTMIALFGTYCQMCYFKASDIKLTCPRNRAVPGKTPGIYRY
ncbi:hypothetical protein RRG08_045226 [Elysia crispata]|uniref:Uncharacterized protein n=1 Tax=Elysia crispata TaxID=231223 RepID=A0AAE1A1G1_9GAST|nr:hypothetical protein RRG08_045226 [Elysia crispata]